MDNAQDNPDLTLKQRKFIGAYLEGKPMVQAAAEAGYAPTTAARGATELLSSPKVRAAIQEALERAGVTLERLASVINAGLDATKATHLVIGGEIQTMESPDWATRHKFVDTLLRLKSCYPSTTSAEVGESYELRVLRYRRECQSPNIE